MVGVEQAGVVDIDIGVDVDGPGDGHGGHDRLGHDGGGRVIVVFAGPLRPRRAPRDPTGRGGRVDLGLGQGHAGEDDDGTFGPGGQGVEGV